MTGIKLFMKTKFLPLFLIVLGFSVIVFGQENESHESSTVFIQENAMSEVVRRILVYNFKPRTRKTIISLAQDGINKNWLPQIENIEFSLVSNKEIAKRTSGIYFFTKPALSKSTYEIGFAFGDPNCEYEGAIWKFRISKNRVRLWLPNMGFGGGCSSQTGNNKRRFGTGTLRLFIKVHPYFVRVSAFL